jgi:hypothetical protein
MPDHSWLKWSGISVGISAAFFGLAAYLHVREVTDFLVESSAWLGAFALLLTFVFAFLAATFGWRKRRKAAKATRRDLRWRLNRKAEEVGRLREKWETGDLPPDPPQRGVIIRRPEDHDPFQKIREEYNERSVRTLLRRAAGAGAVVNSEGAVGTPKDLSAVSDELERVARAFHWCWFIRRRANQQGRS